MKPNYNTVLDLSKPMRYAITMCGAIMPDLETRLYQPKITIKFFRAIGKLCFFLIALFFFFNTHALFMAEKDAPIADKIFNLVEATNLLCCGIRILSIMTNSEFINGFFDQFTSNFRNKMQSTHRQKLIGERMRLINMVSVSFILSQLIFTYILVMYTAIRFGRELHPTKLPGDRSNPLVVSFYVFMEVCTAACYVFSMTSFEWVLLTYVRMTTVELQMIRRQINAIFSTVVWNEKHGICVTTQNIAHGLDGVDTSVKNSFDEEIARNSLMPISSPEGLETYANVVKISEKYLNDIIVHHSRIYMHQKRACIVFGSSIAMTYLYTVFLSASWILSSGIKDDDSADGNLFLLPPFSVMAFSMLAYLSYFGEELIQAGNDVSSDVVGMDWHLYPKTMQKKFVIFLSMCQTSLKLDAWGQGPLCFESFKASCQCCYSLYTFIAEH